MWGARWRCILHNQLFTKLHFKFELAQCRLERLRVKFSNWRIEVIRLVDKVIHRLDLMDATNRKRVFAVNSNAALNLIFGVTNE